MFLVYLFGQVFMFMLLYKCCRELLAVSHDLTLNPMPGTDYRGDPYPFGIDPVSIIVFYGFLGVP